MPFENSTPQPGVKCVRCLDRGHNCYAARILDGKALCAFCMDDEPCLYVQREKANEGQTAPAPMVPSETEQRQAVSKLVDSMKPTLAEIQKPLVSTERYEVFDRKKEKPMPKGVYSRKAAMTGKVNQVAIEVKPEREVLTGDCSLAEAIAFLERKIENFRVAIEILKGIGNA